MAFCSYNLFIKKPELSFILRSSTVLSKFAKQRQSKVKIVVVKSIKTNNVFA